MSTPLERWARIERTFIEEEIAYLQAGGKVLSPSGDDITRDRLDALNKRLEGANNVLEDFDAS